VYVVLLVAMFFGGILYHVMQNGLPKVFSEELRDVIGEGPMMAGLLTSFVFVSGGIMQLIGGGLADRFALNRVYLICWFFRWCSSPSRDDRRRQAGQHGGMPSWPTPRSRRRT
jgi:MFS family permease